jgi:hypothetical protein
LRTQQDLEDKKNEIIIESLEGKIKDHEAALEKKDFVLQTMEGSLAEAQAEIARLNSELSTNSKNFEQEKKDFDAKLEAGHGDFCALLASRGTTVAFMKAGCMHGNIVYRPNFSLSPADLNDIPSLARSIGNKFVTQIWAKGGRSLAGDEARSHLKPVINSYLALTFSLKLEFTL